MANYICVRIGDRIFTTSNQTLTKYPESKLGSMFIENISSIKDGNGNVFIDRDGTHFEHILNFLRCGELNLPKGFNNFHQLKIEVDYYQLHEMKSALESLEMHICSKSNMTSDEEASKSNNESKPIHPIRKRQIIVFCICLAVALISLLQMGMALWANRLGLNISVGSFCASTPMTDTKGSESDGGTDVISKMTEKIIDLNVGSHVFVTSRDTLTKYPDSMLGNMFTQDGTSPAIKDGEGRYFIDRDGNFFKYILNFLRSGNLNLPKDFTEWDQLREEADFFGLEKMLNMLDSLDIDLIVGGQHFITSLKTLSHYPESKLAKMFSGCDSSLVKDGVGRLIIDRDGALFRHILNFLRCQKLHLPNNFADMEHLRAEVDFYGLIEMNKALDVHRPNGKETMWIKPPVVQQSAGQTDYKEPPSLLLYCAYSTFYSFPFPEKLQGLFQGSDYDPQKFNEDNNKIAKNSSAVRITIPFNTLLFLQTITKGGFGYRGSKSDGTMIYERNL